MTNSEPRATWIEMADLFLDTETRTWIPRTAWVALQDGLSVTEAERVWLDEVSPAVSFNLWDVAGEWAGWDQDWLLARIRRNRSALRWLPRLSSVLHRMHLGFGYRMWSAIAGCMELIAARPPDQREAYVWALSWLTRAYFDMPLHRTPALPLAELRRIFADELEPVMRQVVFRTADPHEESRAICAERVAVALGALGEPERGAVG